MRRGIPNLLKDGTRHRSGLQEAVLKNLEACQALADITKTSMGPNGQTTERKRQNTQTKRGQHGGNTGEQAADCGFVRCSRCVCSAASGMNKMLINHLDKIFVTSDTATLLKELEVAHPAAKVRQQSPLLRLPLLTLLA